MNSRHLVTGTEPGLQAVWQNYTEDKDCFVYLNHPVTPPCDNYDANYWCAEAVPSFRMLRILLDCYGQKAGLFRRI